MCQTSSLPVTVLAPIVGGIRIVLGICVLQVGLIEILGEQTEVVITLSVILFLVIDNLARYLLVYPVQKDRCKQRLRYSMTVITFWLAITGLGTIINSLFF